MDIYHLSNLHIWNIVLNCKKTKNAKACRWLLSSRCIKTLIANAGSWHPALVKSDLKHIASTILKLHHRLFVVDKSWLAEKRLEHNLQLWCTVAYYWQGLLEIGFLTSTCDLETWSTWQSNHPFQYETTPLCSGHILKSVLQRWNLSMLSLPATV